MPHETVSSDDEATKGYVGKLVAKTVEETLNALLDDRPFVLIALTTRLIATPRLLSTHHSTGYSESESIRMLNIAFDGTVIIRDK